jgi:4-hydroxybenzoate polyprenyltransferase
MSNFICDKCGKECINSQDGYVTGCEHYPKDMQIVKEQKIQQKLTIVMFEKNGKWWQSMVSDVFTYGLAFFLLLSSWFLEQTLWTIVSILFFFLCITYSSCELKTVKIKTKEEAIKWANSLDDD